MGGAFPEMAARSKVRHLPAELAVRRDLAQQRDRTLDALCSTALILVRVPHFPSSLVFPHCGMSHKVEPGCPSSGVSHCLRTARGTNLTEAGYQCVRIDIYKIPDMRQPTRG